MKCKKRLKLLRGVSQSNYRQNEEKSDPEISIRLKASEEKYRTFFENSMDAILITSQDGLIYSANKAACKMLDWDEKEIIRLGRNGIVEHTPQLDKALKIRKETGRFFGEITFIKKDGTRIPVRNFFIMYSPPMERNLLQ